MKTGLAWPESELLTASIRRHSQALLNAQIVLACLFLGLAIELLPHIGWQRYLAWAGAAMAVDGWRLLARQQVLSTENIAKPGRIYTRFLLQAALSGCVLGIGTGLFMPMLPASDQMLLTIVMCVLPALNLPVCPSRHLIAFYALPVLAMTTWAWSAGHPEQLPATIS